MKILRKKTLQKIGKLARDNRAKLSKIYIYDPKNKEKCPWNKHAEILPESWETHLKHVEKLRDEVTYT